MEATIENKPRPLSEWSTSERQAIKYVFADIDDTMTNEGKLGSSSFESLWRLHDAGIGVIPVTGRPAGWCDAIARQWPVIGVVGEKCFSILGIKWHGSTTLPPRCKRDYRQEIRRGSRRHFTADTGIKSRRRPICTIRPRD